MQRKDALVTNFLDGIRFERKLEKLKTNRKKQLAKVKVDFRQENAIKRRVINLYDRACRKFRQNKILWKEYLYFLVSSDSMQKFNRVVSSAVQIHPDCLDFWLIAAYAELDIKGNLFSSRNLMLQALKLNETKPRFYTEYLKFEVKFLDKLMQRRRILNGQTVADKPKIGDLEFIDDLSLEGGDEVTGEVKPVEESNIVKIVVANLLEKFPQNVLVLKEVYSILSASQYVDQLVFT